MAIAPFPAREGGLGDRKIPMSHVFTFYQSSIGKKVVMAVTGLILFGFVVFHMLGNLKFFQGPDKMNAYGAFLREAGVPVLNRGQVLWTTRIVLLASVGLHILASVQLTLTNRRARPIQYHDRDYVQASYAARTMLWSGLILAFFVIYHVLHFTVGSVHPQFRPDDVYRNVVTGFRVWYVAAFYIVAMVALGLHLFHGVWSLTQSLGLDQFRYKRLLRRFAVVSACVVAAGFLSVPIVVLAGLVS